jgi:hypothetical protein
MFEVLLNMKERHGKHSKEYMRHRLRELKYGGK